MAPLSIRAKSKVVRTLYALPKPVRRLMAGAPVRIDGQEKCIRICDVEHHREPLMAAEM